MLVQVTLTPTQTSTGLKVGAAGSDMTKKECSEVEAFCLGKVQVGGMCLWFGINFKTRHA